MSILYNRTAFYEPMTGIVYILKNNQLVPQAITFSDTEKDMETKQFPTTVKPGYVEVLRQRCLQIFKTFYGLSNFSLDLSLVPNDPAFGPFKFTFSTPSPDQPKVEFSVAQLAYSFNQDPINFTQLRRYIIDQLGNHGYQVS